MDEKITVGWELSHRIVKNRYSQRSANRIAQSRFYLHPAGFRRGWEVIQCAVYLDLVESKGGGNYVICGHKVRGEDNIQPFFDAHPEVLEQLENQILDKMQEVYTIPDGTEEPEEEEAC
jgi:hypothetical protein